MSLFASHAIETTETARAARDAAIERVDEAADPGWKDIAMEAVRRVCSESPTFIVDDVWAVMPTDAPDCREKRAMGAVIVAASRKGWCVGTGDYRASAQRQCHANPRQVWRSLICTQSEAKP